MWISKKLIGSTGSEIAEAGSVTISSDDHFETTTSASSRNIDCYGPFGIDYRFPLGTNVLVLPTSNGNVCIGAKVNSSVEAGEIRLFSSGGASIILKNDGSVNINGLVISSGGEILNGR